ncbi:hypothetical protein AMTRI_Chr10g1490 [Amborella trichopoda]
MLGFWVLSLSDYTLCPVPLSLCLPIECRCFATLDEHFLVHASCPIRTFSHFHNHGSSLSLSTWSSDFCSWPLFLSPHGCVSMPLLSCNCPDINKFWVGFA